MDPEISAGGAGSPDGSGAAAGEYTGDGGAEYGDYDEPSLDTGEEADDETDDSSSLSFDELLRERNELKRRMAGKDRAYQQRAQPQRQPQQPVPNVQQGYTREDLALTAWAAEQRARAQYASPEVRAQIEGQIQKAFGDYQQARALDTERAQLQQLRQSLLPDVRQAKLNQIHKYYKSIGHPVPMSLLEQAPTQRDALAFAYAHAMANRQKNDARRAANNAQDRQPERRPPASRGVVGANSHVSRLRATEAAGLNSPEAIGKALGERRRLNYFPGKRA